MFSAAPRKRLAFYHQAADKYVEIRDVAQEGGTGSNLADASAQAPPPRTKRGRKSAGRSNATRSSATRLRRGRLGLSSPTSRRTPATRPPPTEAKRHAIACYLAYRRDGGENHYRPRPHLPRRDPSTCSPATRLRRRRFSSNSSPIPNASWSYRHFIQRPPSHRRRQPRPRPRRRPGFGLHDGRGNPVPDRDAGEARIAPAPRAGSSTKSPPADRRRLSLMRSPALAYLDMACL